MLTAAGLPAAAKPAAPAADVFTPYSVRAGDTLISIAGRYLSSRKDVVVLRRDNRIAYPRQLPVGRTLQLRTDRLAVAPLRLKVSAASGPVSRDAGAGPSPLHTGDHVDQGDVVATGANAFVTFVAADGSRITLPSQTRLRMRSLRRTLLGDSADRRFDLDEGRGAFAVTPLSKPRDRFEVRTPLSVAAVRGTAFRIQYTARSERAALEVLKGQVAESSVQGVEPQAVIAAGTAAVRLDSGQRLLTPLPPAAELADPGRVQADPVVTFSVARPVPGWRYRVQLGTDAGFVALFAETLTESAATFQSVPNGTLYARLTAIDDKGVEGIENDYSFERHLSSLRADVQADTTRSRHPSYTFRWFSEGEGPATFAFILARDETLRRRIIDEPALTGETVAVTDLAPGTYYWSVAVTHRVNGRAVSRQQPVRVLHISSRD